MTPNPPGLGGNSFPGKGIDVHDNPIFQETRAAFGVRFAEAPWDLPPDPKPWDLKDPEPVAIPISAEIAYVKRLITIQTDTQLMEVIS